MVWCFVSITKWRILLEDWSGFVYLVFDLLHAKIRDCYIYIYIYIYMLSLLRIPHVQLSILLTVHTCPLYVDITYLSLTHHSVITNHSLQDNPTANPHRPNIPNLVRSNPRPPSTINRGRPLRRTLGTNPSLPSPSSKRSAAHQSRRNGGVGQTQPETPNCRGQTPRPTRGSKQPTPQRAEIQADPTNDPNNGAKIIPPTLVFRPYPPGPRRMQCPHCRIDIQPAF